MGKYIKNRYSIDNGQYSRKLNAEGKAEGIEKTSINLGRNDKCLCGSGKKYKNCCFPVGGYFNKKKVKIKGVKKISMLIKLKRIFKFK